MPSARLSTVGRAKSDTATDKKMAMLYDALAEQNRTIDRLTASLQAVAYNALPTPEIVVNFFKSGVDPAFPGGGSASVSLISGQSGPDSNGATLMNAVGSWISKKNGSSSTFFFSSTSDVSWDFGSNELIVSWNFGASNDTDHRNPSIYQGSPVIYVNAPPDLFPVFVNETGVLPEAFMNASPQTSTPIPPEYGRLLNAYDVFRCAYMLSTHGAPITDTKLNIYLLSGGLHGDDLISYVSSYTS